MKTCKTGCGKMKAGGSVKKIKKMADGGSTGLVGMPRYSNNPRSEQGRILKKGGAIKKYPDGGATIPGLIKKDRTEIMRTPSGKAGVIMSVLGSAATGVAMALKKRKEKKAAKEAEKKKKEATTTKAKFGASVNVQRSPKAGKVTGVDGGYAKVGQREPARNKFKSGGSLKPVPTGKVGLAKLPTAVRNKMGFQKKGGSVKK
jgi:hypothetical protein